MNREKLKYSIKKISDWIIPFRFQRIIRNYALSFRGKYKKESWVNAEIKKNKEYENKHHGERCFILCTGPSIKKQDLKPLKNEFTIAVSMFSLHKDYKIIKPNYHLMAPYHPPFTFEDLEKEFQALSQNKCHDTVVFLGHFPYEYSYYNFLKEHPEYKPQNVRYIYYGGSEPIDEYNFMQGGKWDISQKPFQPQTVVYSAIQLAAYMGFSEIYLLGVDQNYLEYISQQFASNFYPDEKRIDDSYIWKTVWRSTENMFYMYHMRWKQFGLMQDYLNTKNIKVFNATGGGLLDVFPKVKYEDVIKHPHSPQ